MKTYTVTFQPDEVKIRVVSGMTIMDAAQRAGIIIDNFCGGAGTCRKCLVEIIGQKEPVLACQYQINRDLAVTIRDQSRFFEQKILKQQNTCQGKIEPMVSKHHLVIDPPDRNDTRKDTQRLIDAIESKKMAPANILPDHTAYTLGGTLQQQLHKKLNKYHYDVTAVCHGRRIVGLERGDTTETLLGVSVDIGTTTVVTNLVNLINGKNIAVVCQTNPQVRFGDDVISRIQYTMTNDKGLKQQQRCIIECINELIGQLCDKAGVDRQNIYELTAAGNSTMQHILLAAPVAQLALAPYVTPFLDAVNTDAAETGIDIHPEGNVYVMPAVAAHVGGDSVAVALATALSHSDKVNLAIDIGTNGELILGNKDGLLACSTAAGPAFEGARIRHGMRGASGAIERVSITDEVEISVIDGGAAAGICGSGLIDAVAELLNIGLIDKSGRMLTIKELADKNRDAKFCVSTSQMVREKLSEVDGKPAFVLVPAEQTKDGRAIVLTQGDVREVQLAKAAIRAGMTTLMRQLKIDWGEVERIYLAGAFGNYVRPESARRIGLLPDVDPAKIQPVGNAAAAGARLVLVNRRARRYAEQLAREIKYVELAGRSDFQELFSESMFFAERQNYAHQD